MSFAAFEGSIASTDLQKVAAHWNAVRGSERIPAWRMIKPAAIVSQLPIVWSYTYDRSVGAFVGRLAGDRIAAIFGKNFKGLPMSDAYPREEFPRLFELSKRVVDQPALYRGAGAVFKHLDRYGIGERVIMPLSEDGVVCDGILGATIYQARDGIASHQSNEIISWFALDDNGN